jgi:iron(III) transport system permease protein
LNDGAQTSSARSLIFWLVLGLAAYSFLPWYVIEEGLLDPEWIYFYPFDREVAPAPVQALAFSRTWLLPIALCFVPPLLVLKRPKTDPLAASVLIFSGAAGLSYGLVQGFLIGPLGFNVSGLEAMFGAVTRRQYGMGSGALIVHLSFLFLFTRGLAATGMVRGDVFVLGALGLVVSLVATFVFFPVAMISIRALELDDGSWSGAQLIGNLFSSKVWGIGLLGGKWGAAWNSLLLATLAALGSTALGVAFALLVTRSRFRFKRALRALTVLPIITPPFVIGLAIILVFGRAGAVTVFLAELFGVSPTRYIFGLPGVLLAQLLSFTPIAFLVLIGVVEGISPSMEEAAQTLRAGRWKTYATVSFPLMRPGLANAFLLGFIESLADFGNPLVLGGSFEVLSTEIYFAVAGAQSDVPRAAALAMVLLAFTLVAFFAQRRWVGRKSYVTMTGKADAGEPCAMPAWLDGLCRGTALPWAVFTVLIYLMILLGGFVRLWGRDNSLTLAHFSEMFGVSVSWAGVLPSLSLTGAAWDSLITTIEVAAISSPLTALLGLLTAYLLARQSFAGHGAFEFGTMLSFAIPGTVIGVSYILAFNIPPIELTGTGAILVICFIFRNMPVGIRAGMASLSQIDRSLDEASLTLGANSFVTVRRVVFPLLRPALGAALIYGFVRAMTAVSAVIFLVSAEHDLATTYILGRVENGDYGPAIAYSSALVVLMMLSIASIQWLVGERNVGRRALG